MQYEGFTSLPPQEEQMMVVFEERSTGAVKAAQRVGYGAAIVVLVLTMMIVLGFWGPIKTPGAEGEGGAAAAETK